MKTLTIVTAAAVLSLGVPAIATAQEQQPTVLATTEALLEAVSPDERRTAAWLGTREALPVAGRVIGEALGKAGTNLAVQPYDRVYVEYLGERPGVGDRLLLVHIGPSLAGHGRMIEPRALLEVEQADAHVMVAVVAEQYGIVEAGQLALPADSAADLRGALAEPVEDGAAGEILAFRVPHALQAPTDEAFLSLGEADGLSVGDEVTAYLPRRLTSDGRGLTLPAEPVARLVVVRVESGTATARVLNVSHQDLRPGLPVRVTARMP